MTLLAYSNVGYGVVSLTGKLGGVLSPYIGVMVRLSRHCSRDLHCRRRNEVQ